MLIYIYVHRRGRNNITVAEEEGAIFCGIESSTQNGADVPRPMLHRSRVRKQPFGLDLNRSARADHFRFQIIADSLFSDPFGINR